MRRAPNSSINRGILLAALATLAILLASPFQISALAEAPTTTNALPSWNDGPAKQAIVDFVKATTRSVEPKLRAARGTHSYLRSRWNTVG